MENRSVREVGSFCSSMRLQYCSTENVLILNWSFSRVVAEHPNPRKLSLVMDEYSASLLLEKVQIELRVYPFFVQ